MIRPALAADIAGIKHIIDQNELFPSTMLDDMIAPYLSDPKTADMWFTDIDGPPQAIAYCAPERMTQGTWNLYLIAVHPDAHGRGIGSAMLHHIEALLAARGERVLLVETSGFDSFARTRQFYLKANYEQEARIRDFYQAGEDKIIFRKGLTAH